MKKMIASLAAGLIGLVAIFGYSLTDVSEFLQLAKTETHEFVEGQIPNTVQIKRVGLILDKLDSEMGELKHELAKAEIGLERSESDWQSAQQSRTAYVRKLRDLRSLDCQLGDTKYVSVSCSKVSDAEVNVKKKATLLLYRECDKECLESKKLMEVRRKSVDSLRQSLGQWNDKRVLLEQRLEVLRTRNEVEIASGRLEGKVSDPSELQRAEELIEKIEERLDIAERERELGDGFSSDLNLDNAIEVSPATDIDSEIDAILSSD